MIPAELINEQLDIPAELDGDLWRHRNRGAVYPTHRHEELEMNLAVRGTASYLVGDRRYRQAAGSMIWLFPEHDHILVDQSSDFTSWILVARPPLAARIARSSPEYATLGEGNPSGEFCRQIPQAACDSLGRILDETDGASDAVCKNAALAFALSASWSAFQRAPESAASIGLTPPVERAVALLRDEVEPLPIGQLGRECGVSASQLSRLFHRQVGIPLVAFRNAQRLERYRRLRAASPISASQAALDAGFGSYAQFYRVYRAAHGHGPRTSPPAPLPNTR